MPRPRRLSGSGLGLGVKVVWRSRVDYSNHEGSSVRDFTHEHAHGLKRLEHRRNLRGIGTQPKIMRCFGGVQQRVNRKRIHARARRVVRVVAFELTVGKFVQQIGHAAVDRLTDPSVEILDPATDRDVFDRLIPEYQRLTGRRGTPPEPAASGRRIAA